MSDRIELWSSFTTFLKYRQVAVHVGEEYTFKKCLPYATALYSKLLNLLGSIFAFLLTENGGGVTTSSTKEMLTSCLSLKDRENPGWLFLNGLHRIFFRLSIFYHHHRTLTPAAHKKTNTTRIKQTNMGIKTQS